MDRLDRAQFFAKLMPLDEEHLRKTLWNLYWRGTAAVRQRIEAELEPGRIPRRVEPERVVAGSVLDEVRDFVALARSGAYIAGDGRVSPKQRTRWRFTFRQLVADARAALLIDDGTAGATALEALLDLAGEVRDVDYFRSDDPIEAAKIVVSDEVAVLWGRILERRGLPAFAEQAAGQLIRWESRYGWTRRGYGQVAEKETSLATVLAGLLPVPDAWTVFTDAYLEELDRLAAPGRVTPTRPWQIRDYGREVRTEALAEWHSQVVERLVDGEAADRLDRLTTHPALAGPELTFLQAQLARRRGEFGRARDLTHKCLTHLPGHSGFLGFAAEIAAPLPPQAGRVAAERAQIAPPHRHR
jgi:hypothetical protein